MTPTHTELCYLTMREAGQLLKRRELSPVELTRVFLDRIEALDSKLQAYITVLPQRAMAAARTAEAEMLRGEYRGPLHGIPIALKDLYDTKDIRTTASSRVMADRVPSEDATTTARLEAAGHSAGQTRHARICPGWPGSNVWLSTGAQSLESCPYPWWLEQRFWHRSGSGALHGFAGLLYGWLDPRPAGRSLVG